MEGRGGSCARFLVFFTVRFVRAFFKAGASKEASHSQPIVWHEKNKKLMGWHMSVHSMGRQGSSELKLAIALHRLLGCQDERCETGKWLCQLQEGMLEKKEKKHNSECGAYSNRTVKTMKYRQVLLT